MMQKIKKTCIANAEKSKRIALQMQKMKKTCIPNCQKKEKKLHSNKVEIIQATFLK